MPPREPPSIHDSRPPPIPAAALSGQPDLDDSLAFADDPDDCEDPGPAPWTLLVVDDDDAVHEVTALALADFSFEGRRLRRLSRHGRSHRGALRTDRRPMHR